MQTLNPIFLFFMQILAWTRALLRGFSCSIDFFYLFAFFLINDNINILLCTFLLKTKHFLFVIIITFFYFIIILLNLFVWIILKIRLGRNHIWINIFFTLSRQHWWILRTLILSQFQFFDAVLLLDWFILTLNFILINFFSIYIFICIHIFIFIFT